MVAERSLAVKRKGAGSPNSRRLRLLARPAPKLHLFSEGTPIRGREAATSPTRRDGLLPGLPSSPLADRAGQDGPKFAPRTEHPPRAMLEAATPLPFARHAAADAAPSASPRADVPA